MSSRVDVNKEVYVSGFLMDYDMERFVLIDKAGKTKGHNVPMYWQGIGGKINMEEVFGGFHSSGNIYKVFKESPSNAIEREFAEETGHRVAHNRWHLFHIKNYDVARIYFLVAFGSLKELSDVVLKASKLDNKEGVILTHSLVDVYFDGKSYTFDIPYLIQIIIREQRAGMLMKLEPDYYDHH